EDPVGLRTSELNSALTGIPISKGSAFSISSAGNTTLFQAPSGIPSEGTSTLVTTPLKGVLLSFFRPNSKLSSFNSIWSIVPHLLLCIIFCNILLSLFSYLLHTHHRPAGANLVLFLSHLLSSWGSSCSGHGSGLIFSFRLWLKVAYTLASPSNPVCPSHPASLLQSTLHKQQCYLVFEFRQIQQ